MANTDLHTRAHSIAGVLHRFAHGFSPSRRTDVASAEPGRPPRLDPATLHDIGASPAYRDYASRPTLGAGTQSRDLAYLARWGAVR